MAMKRVAFIGLTRSGIDGAIMRGVVDASHELAGWHLSDAGHDRSYLGDLIERGLEGVIGNVTDREFEQKLIDLGLAAVNTSDALESPRLTTVMVDNQEVGRLAAEHLLQRGLKCFAFVGQSKYAFTLDRLAGFRDRVEQAGGTVLRPAPITGSQEEVCNARVQWLGDLPKPLGLMASTDSDGWTYAQVCQQAGLVVPDAVAIISSGNDQFTCHLSDPPLTSVGIPGQIIGRRAAEKLDRLLSDGRLARRKRHPVIRIPPNPVAIRQSTNVMAVSDAALADALRHIRNHATKGLTVEGLLREIPLGRRDLERRFQRHLHRSPLEEIRRVRMQEAERLLVTTALPMDKLAERCGYNSADQFTRAFKQTHRTTPGRYRREHAR
jgi:LacI family transcriptional regulator